MLPFTFFHGTSFCIEQPTAPFFGVGLVNDFNEQAARSAGVKVVDEGAGGNALSEFLAEKRLA